VIASIPVQIRHLICTGILLLGNFLSSAQDMYWTPEARSAYFLLAELRIDEGLSIVRLHALKEPGNYIWPYLEDYGEFLGIFVQEDLRKVSGFLTASAARQSKIAIVPESNPLSLMAQGQLYLHQCALHLQQGQFMAAATDINKSFKLLKKNHKLHPGDVANLRLYASLKVAYGAIPDKYRWLVAILSSLSGTIEEGLSELYSIIQTTTPLDNVFHVETIHFAALAEGRMNNQPRKAIQLLQKHFGKMPPNPVTQFIMAGLMIDAGDNDGAIKLMSQKTVNKSALRIPFMEFMLGECKLNRGDADAASHFKNFLILHKGKHYIKEAHQKLAWYALLRDDRTGYYNHMQQILIKGSATTDEDQQAMREAEYHATPHPVLLRARLYYDGGYYDKALELLTEEFYGTLHQHAHRLEFLYRKGRILQARKQYAQALYYLRMTITSGQLDRYYFACSAALQCGLIHENLGNKDVALTFFNQCLSMSPEIYSTSLHQKARMGINRLHR